MSETKFELANVVNVFSSFYEQLEEVKKVNEQTVFDYESKKGNKDARSHIYKLRQSKTAVNKAHKEAKAEALEFGRGLDSEKKKLISEFDEMIAVHEEPLKVIEEREKQRIETINKRINYFEFYTQEENIVGKNSYMLSLDIDVVEGCIVDDSYEEFKDKAELARFKCLEFLKNKFTEVKSLEEAEAKRIETERLEQEHIEKEQKEKSEKQRIEREKQIAENAKIEAENKAKRDAEIAEQNRINELSRIEREKQEEIDKAKRDAESKIIAEKQRIESERLAKEKAEQEEKQRIEKAKLEAEEKERKRQANRAHQKRINNTVLEYLKQLGCNEETGKNIVKAMAKSEIPNVTINY